MFPSSSCDRSNPPSSSLHCQCLYIVVHEMLCTCNDQLINHQAVILLLGTSRPVEWFAACQYFISFKMEYFWVLRKKKSEGVPLICNTVVLMEKLTCKWIDYSHRWCISCNITLSCFDGCGNILLLQRTQCFRLKSVREGLRVCPL